MQKFKFTYIILLYWQIIYLLIIGQQEILAKCLEIMCERERDRGIKTDCQFRLCSCSVFIYLNNRAALDDSFAFILVV